jgi:predicted porin
LRWILDDDEVGGYDDVARLEVRGRLSWRHRKRTEVLAELRYGEYFYDSRERSVDDMRHRERSYWVGSLTVEHAFNKRLAGLFRYEFRENAGNNSVDRYSTQILSTGIRLTF